VIAVDMPIGLPERRGRGGRPCEVEVRDRIGARRSSVFAVPARAAVMAGDYRAACAVSLLHSDPPRKVSKQTFMLFPYMREVDALMSPQIQTRVYEVHPELSFWAMNDGQPLALPKKVKGRPFDAGLALRRSLLAAAGFPLARLRLVPGVERAGRDDILDACAAAWSARRIRDGEHLRLPADPPRDAKGLRMEINA
jgi:predicted RNase H-like nuclease